jgi:hypothetical protein
MKKVLGSLALVAGMAVGFGGMALLEGCALRAGAHAPAVPQDFYQKAALSMSDFSVALLDAQQVVVSLHTAGTIDEATNRTIEDTMRTIALDGKSVDALIAVQASPWAISAKITATAELLARVADSGGLAIQDPQARAKFVNAVGYIKTALQVVAVYFNAQSAEVIHGPDNDFIARRACRTGASRLSASYEAAAGRPEEVSGRAAGQSRLQFRPGDRRREVARHLA